MAQRRQYLITSSPVWLSFTTKTVAITVCKAIQQLVSVVMIIQRLVMTTIRVSSKDDRVSVIIRPAIRAIQKCRWAEAAKTEAVTKRRPRCPTITQCSSSRTTDQAKWDTLKTISRNSGIETCPTPQLSSHQNVPDPKSKADIKRRIRKATEAMNKWVDECLFKLVVSSPPKIKALQIEACKLEFDKL